MRNDTAEQSRVANTERSEQKVQGHAPGQGQGVKPIVGVKGQSPLRSKFLVRLRSQEMGRASIGASLLSGAEKKKKKHKLKQITKRCRSKILCTAFTISLSKVKSAKSEAILRHNKPWA